MDSKILAIINFGIVGLIILCNIIETIYRAKKRSEKKVKTNHIGFTVIGIIGASICALHGYGEIAHREKILSGLFFEANTGRSLYNIPTEQWTGWIAITVIPNFLISGVIVLVLSALIFLWSIFGFKYRYAGIILLILFITIMIFGGGFIPIMMGIIASFFGIRMKFALKK